MLCPTLPRPPPPSPNVPHSRPPLCGGVPGASELGSRGEPGGGAAARGGGEEGAGGERGGAQGQVRQLGAEGARRGAAMRRHHLPPQRTAGGRLVIANRCVSIFIFLVSHLQLL